MKVLLDSNVIIDAFTNRPNSNQASKQVLRKAISGDYEGCISSKQITDIYYVLRKYVDEKTRLDVISLLLENLTVLPFDKKDLESAIKIPGDYEDTVLASVAKRHKLKAIVTNDNKGFPDWSNPIHPQDFLETISHN